MIGKELLKRNWSQVDKKTMQRLIDSLYSNKFFIPKTLLTDIEAVIDIMIILKDKETEYVPVEIEIEEDSSKKKGYFPFF